MVLGLPALLFGVPAEEREVDDPEEVDALGVDEALHAPEVEAHLARRGLRELVLVRDEQRKSPVFAPRVSAIVAISAGFRNFAIGALRALRRQLDPREALGAVGLRDGLGVVDLLAR